MNYKIAIVLNPIGHFGGAQKRILNLFQYLYNKYPENVFFFTSYDLYNYIIRIHKDFPLANVFPVGQNIISSGYSNSKNIDLKPDGISFLKKIYKLGKNYYQQKRIFKEIDEISKKKGIKIFLGVASGIIPLYFYLKKNQNIVIFSDMDSWFTDIVPQTDFWYRKYSSYNYALENSDFIDFLNPYILNGIVERGIRVNKEKIAVAPCSFSDYSKCKYGDKSIFQVAFAGRLEERKNPLLFLDVAKELIKIYPDIIFHIMGEGRLSDSVKQECERINSRNIIFYGFHPNPPEILANTSVFVSIQSTNNYPSQSVLEAMGCGNAIVASDVGDTRMFVNEKNGILINLNKNELFKAIEKLYLNKTICEEMGKYSYKFVRENHTLEKMTDYYLELFDKASKLKK